MREGGDEMGQMEQTSYLTQLTEENTRKEESVRRTRKRHREIEKIPQVLQLAAR